MIHYSLICEAEHGFEGWFRSSNDFDAQADQGFVACPICGSTTVHRDLMAPNVQVARDREVRDETVKRQAVMMPDTAQKTMLEALREIRKKVVENATYVGDRFAEEARRMHYGEIDHQGIYGEATSEEVEALADEGVEFQSLPNLPEDGN